MCTLIVAWRVFDDAPICVAANRDEASGRPASPPRIREGDPSVLAPRDERAGGTWIGYNESGVLVAVTNRWVPGDGDRSRGLLVDDALEMRSARDAADRVEADLRARAYAPFHLLVADENDCLLLTHDSKETATHQLSCGVHVVVNVGFDGKWFVPDRRPDDGRRQAKNAARVYEVLQPRDDETAVEWIRRAGQILGDHEYGVCIHGDGFGTRSSSLLRLGSDRVYEFADGPPCEAPFQRIDAKL